MIVRKIMSDLKKDKFEVDVRKVLEKFSRSIDVQKYTLRKDWKLNDYYKLLVLEEAEKRLMRKEKA